MWRRIKPIEVKEKFIETLEFKDEEFHLRSGEKICKFYKHPYFRGTLSDITLTNILERNLENCLFSEGHKENKSDNLYNTQKPLEFNTFKQTIDGKLKCEQSLQVIGNSSLKINEFQLQISSFSEEVYNDYMNEKKQKAEYQDPKTPWNNFKNAFFGYNDTVLFYSDFNDEKNPFFMDIRIKEGAFNILYDKIKAAKPNKIEMAFQFPLFSNCLFDDPDELFMAPYCETKNGSEEFDLNKPTFLPGNLERLTFIDQSTI